MTETLIYVVLIFLAYLLIGKIEDIGYCKGYQDGAANNPPKVKIGYKPNQSQDDDKSTIR